MAPAVRALPAASNRKFRPVRVDIARRPTRPRLIAAMAGVTIPAVSPCRISARNTSGKVGTSARISAEANAQGSLASLHIVELRRSGGFRGQCAAFAAVHVAREADELDAIDPGLARLEDAADRGTARAQNMAGRVEKIAGNDDVVHGIIVAVARTVSF